MSHQFNVGAFLCFWAKACVVGMGVRPSSLYGMPLVLVCTQDKAFQTRNLYIYVRI